MEAAPRKHCPFWVKEVKEFWLEPNPELSAETIRKMVDVAKPHTILTDVKLPGITAKIASRLEGMDILVTSRFDHVLSAKINNTPVALEVTIGDQKDLERISQALELGPDYLLINCPNWKIIPLENLVAETRGRSKLLARTTSFDESRTALSTLELGADGIALASHDTHEILKTRDLILGESEDISLSTARVTSVRPIGTGARVCVDTTEILEPGEGLLTGSSSQALFLVEGEIHPNAHVNSRPFRVNAGPVSSYVLSANGKTRYLSELSTGEAVLLVDRMGRTRSVDIARIKIERRPMILVEASIGSQKITTILQNAETVRLVTKDGSKPLSEIKPGDEVLVRSEEGGRHFGTKVADEMVIER
ncbi:3-dehydroquinate synthase II [Candidatus Bathyarchaeota archaeon]|nr:MAG: 3-dehydroquinate synthase II [Candidatus Bathyarchaeota archaeon]